MACRRALHVRVQCPEPASRLASQVHTVLQEAGLLSGLVGALARQRDMRAFTAAARALFPVPNQPRVPDTTVPWPAPRREGMHLGPAIPVPLSVTFTISPG